MHLWLPPSAVVFRASSAPLLSFCKQYPPNTCSRLTCIPLPPNTCSRLTCIPLPPQQQWCGSASLQGSPLKLITLSYAHYSVLCPLPCPMLITLSSVRLLLILLGNLIHPGITITPAWNNHNPCPGIATCNRQYHNAGAFHRETWHWRKSHLAATNWGQHPQFLPSRCSSPRSRCICRWLTWLI